MIVVSLVASPHSRPGPHDHWFGGARWSIFAPAGSRPAPIELATIDLADPLLDLGPRKGLVPLCTRPDGMSLLPQSYSYDEIGHTVAFDGPPWSVEVDPADEIGMPLPACAMRLRRPQGAEDNDTADRWDAQDTFLGGSAFFRVGGAPIWLNGPETARCSCGRPCTFVAGVGYEHYDTTTGMLAGKPFFIGEMALYFLACFKCHRVVVLSQST